MADDEVSYNMEDEELDMDDNVKMSSELDGKEAEDAMGMDDHMGDDKPAENLKSLPVRAYLDKTVVPLLLQGMSALVKARPDDPVTWLARFLLKHKADNE
eukprot:TRINITY_DN65862_c7_g1_i2.p4 TRINITY_DN65862_c7_g1~~TRINITY_DN65862_c7_g1_i2.p4  ORF type:complete len:100 (-),score=59.06 TRINITY_DN65862_c7_g1_i2:706-1005(-)